MERLALTLRTDVYRLQRIEAWLSEQRLLLWLLTSPKAHLTHLLCNGSCTIVHERRDSIAGALPTISWLCLWICGLGIVGCRLLTILLSGWHLLSLGLITIDTV